MPLIVPTKGTEITVVGFGKPVVDEVNRLSGQAPYKIAHYAASLAATTAIPNTPLTLVTIAMPAAPAGTLLDISWMVYENQGAVGTQGTVYFAQVNGVNKNPQCITPDSTHLMTFSGRIVNVAAPVGVAYNVALIGQKLAATGTTNATGLHTGLHVVSYQP